jgi:hypothetical protein
VWPALRAARLRTSTWSVTLARNNYGFEKRQRELNRERKKAEKQQRKLDRMNPDAEGSDPAESADPGETPEAGEPTPP